jgi:uncharacterized protein YdaU (DUF1376 family)
MGNRPWYKRWPSNFIAGTIHMTLEEAGAYSFLIDLTHDRGGPIVDDPQYLARVCKCSVRKWKALRQRLIDLEKVYEADGFLHQPRALRDIDLGQAEHSKFSYSGRKGGEKSSKSRSRIDRNYAENRPTLNENNDLAKDRLVAREKSREEEESITPLIPLEGGEEKPPKKRKRKSNLPDNWQPNPHAKIVAINEGYDDDERRHIFLQFTGFAASTGRQYADWDAAFYNWIRNGITRNDIEQRRRAQNQKGGRSAGGSVVASINRFIAESSA